MSTEQTPLPSAPTMPPAPVSWPARRERPATHSGTVAATARVEREPAPTGWPRVYPGL